MTSPEFAVKSSRIAAPGGMRPGALLIAGATIRGVVSARDIPAGWPVSDVGTAAVLPGLVDTHVHVNEPGRTEWEGFETATRAAAAGGITTILDMPLNSSPVTTTRGALDEKRAAALGKLSIDAGFVGGIVPGNASELPGLIDAGVFAFKAFLIHSGIDEFPNACESDLRAAMPLLAARGVPLLVHAELGDSLPAAPDGDARRYRSYLDSRPRRWENSAIELMIRLCRETGCRVHIVHLSSADAVPMIARAKADGVALTAETCPHYLTFSAEHIPDGDTYYKCAPPIREEDNRERLWDALRSGVIDFIVSDHSPCVPELKLREAGDFSAAWGGISSLQLTFAAVWTEASERGYGLDQLSAWMSGRPAAFAGLRMKGALAEGRDADFTVVDTEAEFEVSPSALLYRNKITPYAGRRLRGAVLSTYLGGKKIYDRGEFTEGPQGKMLAR